MMSSINENLSKNKNDIKQKFPILSNRMKYGRESILGSNIMFAIMLIVLILFSNLASQFQTLTI
jgi:hypothetical protein